jgi:dienelactone hydrolase
MLLSLCLTALAAPAPATASLNATPVVTPVAAPAAVATSTASVKPVRLVADDKVELSATYYQPRKMKAKNPAVILIHDAGSDQEQLEKLAENFQKKGFAAMTIDVRGHGQSKGEALDWDAADDKSKKSMWAHAKKDVAAAAHWLADRLEVHASNLTLVGIGAGAGLATHHALQDESSQALVLVDPSEDCFGFDLDGDLAELGGLPTLILAPKEGKKRAMAMQKAAHAANDGYEYVELSILKCDRAKLIGDKRLNSSSTSWTKGKVAKGD